MPKHSTFNSGYTGRYAGVSPKDHRTTAGARRKIERKSDRQTNQEVRFTRHCQEVLREKFETSDFTNWTDIDAQRDFLNQAFNEVVSESRVSRKTSTRVTDGKRARIALFVMVLLVSELLGSHVVNNLMKDVYANPILEPISKGLTTVATIGLGAEFGGLPGAALGAAFSMSDFADAKRLKKADSKKVESFAVEGSVVKTIERKSDKKPVLKKVQFVSPTKTKDRYPVESMLLPKSQVFVADPKASDWVLTLDGKFITLAELVTDKSYAFLESANFVLVKNSRVKDLVERGDEEGFESMIDELRKDLLRKFDESGIVFRSETLGPVESVSPGAIIEIGNVISDIADNISKTLDVSSRSIRKVMLVCYNEVVEDYKKQKGFLYTDVIISDLFQTRFKERLKETILKDTLDRVLDLPKKDSAVFDVEDYESALKKFHELQLASVRAENYDDRREAMTKFSSDPDAVVILSGNEKIDIDLDIGRDLWAYESMGQRPVIVFDTKVATSSDKDLLFNTVMAHESLHVRDTTRCRILRGEKGNIVLDIVDSRVFGAIPCSDREGIFDKKISIELVKAFNTDMQNYVIPSAREKLSTVDESRKLNDEEAEKAMIEVAPKEFGLFHIDYTLASSSNMIKSVEIIPMVTDLLTPGDLLEMMPNVAVVRARVIYQDSAESRLYKAMLEGNYSVTKKMIERNPALLDSEYDGIPLHKVPEILVAVDYDKKVDASLKSKRGSYRRLDGLVQGRYRDYKRIAEPSSTPETAHATGVASRDSVRDI